jgi:glycine cleavage system aminomethyltransferase T
LPRARELPARARVVIVGGGVAGTSIAYHLAQLGEHDVVLVDRAELTSGSTFHSAGLVGQLRGSVSLTRMMMDSVALYRRLAEACGWVECGGLRLACTPEREQELHRQVGWARTFGLPLVLLSPGEAAELFPLMTTDRVRAASFLPTDGYLDPSQLTHALADGARAGGCRIFTHTRVTAIDVDAGRVRGVQTEWGPIEAEVVVNAGGLFVAAGFCAHGLAGAGGMDKAMAEWIVAGEPEHDLWEMDIRRFGAQYRSPTYTLERTREVYETYYDIKYPGHERSTGRPLRVSSAYTWHRDHGAAFGEKSGWERVNWYEANAHAGDEALRPRGWAGQLWSPAIGAEHVACRERAALFDESSFAKIEVAGPGAMAFLESLCDNRVAGAVGRIAYTQMLNRRGGIECDFTVTRVAEDPFAIVTGTAFGNHDLSWIRRHAPGDGSVRVSDVTARWACFALWGPRARDVLAPLTPDPLDFPYMTMRDLTVGDVPVRALRVTFVGELGWELYCPTEYGTGLWRTLWEAGAEHGLVAGGYRAIDTLRLEKGYRVWAADITADETPHEAGLSFCVRDDKEFVGRAALAARPIAKRLRCLVLEDPRSVALGNEPVRVGGDVVGRVTTAATATRWRARSRTPTCRPSTRSAPPSRSTCSGAGWPARWSPSRSTTREGNGCGDGPCTSGPPQRRVVVIERRPAWTRAMSRPSHCSPD